MLTRSGFILMGDKNDYSSATRNDQINPGTIDAKNKEVNKWLVSSSVLTSVQLEQSVLCDDLCLWK